MPPSTLPARLGAARWLLLAAALVLQLAAAASGLPRPPPLPLPSAACAKWAITPADCALNVVWPTPTPEPGTAHRNTNGPVISGGMPIGNGETALLVFPLVPIAGSNFALPGAAGPFVLQVCAAPA